MKEITNRTEYYEALALTKEIEDEVIKTFASLERLGYNLKSIAEFDLSSARELGVRVLKRIGENYPNIYGIRGAEFENYQTPIEEMAILIRQQEIKDKFAER